ncbi:MAG: PqqD family protein [Pyrinomonadaceae bacterium]|nr:PqqD family protein [Pyrinomonadaceae bacterium]
MSSRKNTPKTPNENIVIQEMGYEILIYDLKENKAFCLNETSALIWQLCDGTKTVTEISENLSGQSKQTIKEDLVWLALDSFKKNNLLENNKEFEIDFNGLNRRQVIKKVGVASLIALPVISSLVAPTAAYGASLAPLFAGCTSPSDCASNFCTQGPPRCCVPGTAGIRGANVCCDGTPTNCNAQCCSNTGTISPLPGCPGGFVIACPNS